MNKDDALAVYLKHAVPDLVEDDMFSSSGVVVSIPQASPTGAVTRHQETAASLFNRVMDYNEHWVKPGHRSGDNRHNVSATISVKEHEWADLKTDMWVRSQEYSGMSLLPFDGGSYVQAPFEDCTKEKYEQMSEFVKEIDLKQVREETDNTVRVETVACAGGVCEIV
jgi:ribonucleoside-diphosphate reductase alpha chain